MTSSCWTDEQNRLVRDLYVTDMPMADIGKLVGCSVGMVKYRAHRMGLIRPSRWTSSELESLRAEYASLGQAQMAAKLGRSRKSVGIRAFKLGLTTNGRKPGFRYDEARRQYPIESSVQDGTHKDFSYLLGLITADGNIHGARVAIASADPRHLRAVLDHFGLSQPLGRRTTDIGTVYKVTICSKPLALTVKRLGLTERKSLTCRMPSVSDSAFASFLLGYFDGDGGIRFTPRGGLRLGFTSGSRVLLEQLSARIARQFHLHKRPVTHDRGRPNACRLLYHGRNAAHLAEAMYGGATLPFLQRKRARFEAYCLAQAEKMAKYSLNGLVGDDLKDALRRKAARERMRSWRAGKRILADQVRSW